jgi:hypothetical protein
MEVVMRNNEIWVPLPVLGLLAIQLSTQAQASLTKNSVGGRDLVGHVEK